MATKNATYRIYNGTAWEDVYFKTSAAQVGESTTLKFLRPSTHTVNGKSFFDASGNAKAITLTGEDIMFDDIDNISTCISDLSGRIYIVSSAYIKSISSTSDADKINLTWTKQDGSTSSVDIPKSISDATVSASGLMSPTDKQHLDSMYNLWAADPDSGDGSNTLVNKVAEVLQVFENFKEGDNISALLASKVDKNTYSGFTVTTNNAISGLETSVQTLGTQKADAADVYDKTAVDNLINPITNTLNGISAKIYRQIFEGSTTPTNMVSGDIWIQY